MKTAQGRDVKGEAEEYLKRKYLRVLRNEYGISEEALRSKELDSSQLETQLRGLDVIQAEEHAFRQLGKTTGIIFTNFLWRELLSDVLATFSADSKIRKAAIFMGEVPNPKFNARTLNCGNERFLILLNKGLMLFLFRFSRILVASARIDSARIAVEPEISPQEGRVHALRNLKGVFSGQHEPPMRLRSKVHIRLAAEYTYAMEQFVIAHEVGHVLQHLLPKRDQEALYLHEKPWNREFAADMFAALMCHNLVDVVHVKKRAPLELVEIVFAEVPYIVFRIMQALEEYAQLRRISGWITHPPAKLRKERLLLYQVHSGASPTFKSIVERAWDLVTYLLKEELTEGGVN